MKLKRLIFLLAPAVMLSACATVPDQEKLSALEIGARTAEVAYVAGVQAGFVLVYTNHWTRRKFQELDFKAYNSLIILRNGLTSLEPQSAAKVDYVSMKENSDRQHQGVIEFTSERLPDVPPIPSES